MSKDSSAKYYQNKKEQLKKKFRESYQNFSKEKKEISKMVLSDTKVSKKMKNKSLLSIEKNIIK